MPLNCNVWEPAGSASMDGARPKEFGLLNACVAPTGCGGTP
jgi:hypothetical protein